MKTQLLAIYKRLLGPFAMNGVDMIVQGAVLNKKYKNMGFHQSGWTDDTQVLPPLTWPAMAYPAAAAWQSGPVDRDRFFTTYAKILYPSSASPHVASGLGALARAETFLQRSLGGDTIRAFWANPFGRQMLVKAKANQAGLRECRLAAEDANVRSLLEYETSSKYHTRISDLLDEITELREKFRECWLYEYTPFRLGLALGKYDAEFQFRWWEMNLNAHQPRQGFS